MSVIRWNSAVSGNWNDGTKWQGGVVPGAGDDAIIDVAGTYTVTIPAAATANSLTVNNVGATVQLNSTLTIGTALDVTAGSFLLNSGGTIVGGTVTGSGFVFNGGTLSGVTYQGAVDLSASSANLKVTNGISLTGAGGSGPGTVQLTGGGSHLSFSGTQTVDDATVSIGGTASYAYLDQTGVGGALTLGANFSIDQVARFARFRIASANTVVNNGTIDAGATSGSFYMFGAGAFVNQGAIDVSNGEYFHAQGVDFTNAAGGSLAIGVGSQAEFGSSSNTFSNQGTITLGSGAVLHLGGTFTQGDIGALTNSGGTVSIDGTLANIGSVLSTGSLASLGSVALASSGTIVGGTVTGGGMLFRGGVFDAVTHRGVLDLSVDSSQLDVINGITLTDASGGLPGSVLLTGDASHLSFSGTQNFDYADISIGGTSSYAYIDQIGSGGTLTLGANVTIDQVARFGRFRIGPANTVVSNGTINAGVTSGAFYVFGGGAFVNQGVIDVSNGEYFRARGVDFTNASGALLVIGAGSDASLGLSSQTFSNQGTITLGSGALLRLFGSFDQGDIGALTNSGGTVSIEGTLDNTASVLATGTAAGLGTVALTTAGDIVGGTITGAGLLFNGGTLDGVTHRGTLDLSANSSQLRVVNGITLTDASGALPGTVLLTGGSSRLRFSGSQTLDNAAVSIGGTSSYAYIDQSGTGGTLTLGANLPITQTGRFARISVTTNNTIVNNATITAGYTLGGLYLFSSGVFINQGAINVSNGEYFHGRGVDFTNAVGASLDIGAGSKGVLGLSSNTFSNQGTITVGSGAVLHLGGSFNQGNIGALTNSGGTVSIDGTLDNIASVLTTGIAAALGTVALSSTGVVVGGTLTGGGMLFNGGTLVGATYRGILDLSATSARLQVSSGITLTDASGGLPGSVLVTGGSSRLSFTGDETVDYAAISIGGTASSAYIEQIGAGGTLTLGANLPIAQVGRFARVRIAGAANTIVNNGTIDAGVTPGSFYIFGGGSFVNQGAFLVRNGDYLQARTVNFTNASGASLAIGAGSQAVLGLGSYTFFNQGTITVGSGAELRLGGSFNQTNIGALTNSGGTVTIVNGTLDNTGNVLTTGAGASLGTVALAAAGTIIGGTLTGSGLVSQGGTLSGVTYRGALDLSPVNSFLHVTNGITLSDSSGVGPASISVIGNGSRLFFHDSQLVDNATIALGAVGAYALVEGVGAGGTLTLGSGLTITHLAPFAQLYIQSATNTVVNTGTILAYYTGGRFVINGTGTFVNQGLVSVTNGDTMRVTSVVAGAGTFGLNGNATLAMTTSVASTETVDFAGSAGHLVLAQPTSFYGAVVTFENGDTVDFQGIGLAAHYDYSGGVLTLQNSYYAPLAQVTLSTPITNPIFTLGTDGAGGTIVGITPSAAGMIFNSTTIGIVLDVPAVENPATIASGATITNVTSNYYGDVVYGTSAADWSVYNFGLVAATAAGAHGINLAGSGYVVNQLGATVSGQYGIKINGADGTVVNAGTIATTPIGGPSNAIDLEAGGTVVNAGLIDSVGGLGVYIGNASGLIDNSGSILTHYGAGYSYFGAYLRAGGQVINRASGLINGDAGGISVQNAAGTVVNYGTIAAGQPTAEAVHLYAGGSVSNGPGGASAATIIGGYGVVISGAAGTVANYGTIAGTTEGVDLRSGGLVVNGAYGATTALISGYFAVAMSGAGTVVNYGTIERPGSNGAAVLLLSGGTVVNQYTGLISGPSYGNAVRIDGGAGILLNNGTIQGGSSGDNAVYFSNGGSVGNDGLIAGANDVVRIRVQGLVSNDGTIAATGGTPVWLTDGGTVINYGLIIGTDDAVFTGFTTGTVINSGTIIDTGSYGDGVCLEAGGTVVNSGTISGPSAGVEIQYGLGNVANTGTIGGGGILMTAGGTVSNAATGFVTGTSVGIAISDATAAAAATGTVLNYGTITGLGSYGTGIWLISGGSVINAVAGGVQGLIQGFDAVVIGSNAGGVGTVVNQGSIAGDNVGVWLEAGGTVENSAAITATTGDGVVIGSYGGLGNVLNYGTILAPILGVWLRSGGSIGNYGTIASTSPYGFGIDIENGPGVVTNYGTISGYDGGIWLEQGGTVANFGTVINPGTYGRGVRVSNYGGGAGYIRNFGLIAGPTTGVLADASSVVNYGTIAGTGAYGDGVVLGAYPGTLLNFGTILATVRGVHLDAGGSVDNQAGGVIGGRVGVEIYGVAGLVRNLGTITGTAGPGVHLFGGGVTNGDGATPTALIAGASSGIIVYDTSGTVTNYGAVTASITYASAINLVAGGVVQNTQTGLIQGGGDGVAISGPGIVSNSGTIAGVYGSGVRIDGDGVVDNGISGGAASIIGARYGVVLLNEPGSVLNGASGSTSALIQGGVYGIFALDSGSYYGGSLVNNYGTITGATGAGVFLHNGGIVQNRGGALIGGANNGVQVAYAFGQFINYGTVQAGNRAVYMTASGLVINRQSGVIAGAGGIGINGGLGTVVNLGAVSATGTSGAAVILSQGGRVNNGSSAVTGASLLGTARGITVYNAAGTVTNFGTIASTITYASAINLFAGGTITNRQGGLIRGGGDGLYIAGAAGTVINSGSIDGASDTGVVLASGGLIVNGPSGATLATISGGAVGVRLLNVPGTIVNYGTIVDADYAGVVLSGGGSISNSGLITGYQYGVLANGGPGTVSNSGQITATGTGGTGVSLQAGGAIDNSGVIAGSRNGVFFSGATNVSNDGLISGTSLAGIYGGSGVGVIANYGTISGGLMGVQLAGGSTLFNAGTVSGSSHSVYFINGGNRLVIDPSAAFVGGNIDASVIAGGDVLELAAGIGTLSGFGTGFIGFEAMAVAVAADWQVAGSVNFGSGFILTDAGALDFDNDLINDGILRIETGAVLSFTGTVGGSGVIDFNGANGVLVLGVPSSMSNSITDFAPTDKIGFVGIGLAASYSYSGGTLRLNNSGGTQIAQVSLTTPVTNPHFTLTSDGISGTVVEVNALTGTFTGTYFNGVVLNDPTVQNPALVTSTAFITNNYGGYGGSAVYGTSSAAWNLTNQGTITTNPTATSAAGVRLQTGGTVSNVAIISGGSNGIAIAGGAGLVGNSGVVVATNAGSGAGIALLGGGNVSNAAGGTIAGFSNGVFISGGIGAVANAGTIQSSATAGGPAVYLAQGGAVTNLAGGLITAYRSAVSINGSAGQISNYGTIAHSNTQSAASYLGAGGVITNGVGGLIFSPHRNAVVISGAAGTLTNSGTILNTATFAQVGTIQTGRYGAVVLNAGGLVSNAPNALIAGHTGIDFNNLVGTVVNDGTIFQNDPIRYGAGVLLYGGGLVQNGPTALIAAYTTGVQVSASSQGLGAGGPGTVVNYGTIAHVGAGTSGSAIYLGGGGIVVNYGLISGSRPGSGTSGYPGAVHVRNQSGVIINLGTITNPNDSNAVTLLSGGVLINGANGFNAALIDAPHGGVYIGGTLGVPTPGAAGTVLNYGTIRNTTSLGSAVVMAAGGSAINYGLISSARTGVAFTDSAGIINNFGTIVSTAPLSGTRGAGVYLGAGGVITNEAGGLITAYRAAVSLAFFGTTTADSLITNFGVLSGAIGISIGAGDTGDNTIVNYGTITGTNGIAILLGGGDDEIVIASTSQLNGVVSNFQVGDTFDLPFLVFSSAETVSLGAGNVLQISQSGALVYTIQLDPSDSFTGNQFRLANDGTGGTLVALGPDTTPPVTQQRVLAVDANSGPTPIGILAPTDPDDLPAVLTVTVNGLPADGTVMQADGVTPVSAGQILSVDQLTSLTFIPTPGLIGQSSTLTYSVSDPAGNTGFGTAFLGINLPEPPNSPDLINGLGGAEGFGENVLPRFDDGSSTAIDITSVFGPGGLNFFGQPYTQLFVNNNGNITFNSALSAYTPGPITAGLNNPIIAAFWADVDTRGGPGVPTGGNATGSNLVYYDLDTVNHVFTVTWDDVGYFGSHNDKLDAFQLQLIDQGGGNFDIEFRYQAIYWTTGDASGGSGGLGGTVARAGFSAGDGIHAYELPQSGNQNAMLEIESNPAPPGTLGVTSDIGVYRFQVRNGVVIPPVPAGLALSPASDSGKPGDNRTNDTTPTITGLGINGDTVTLLANGAVVGTGAVAANGTWSVTASALPDGIYAFTATQTDSSGTSSFSSVPLFATIDTSAPVTVPVSRTVAANTGPAVIGIALPTDPDDDFSDPNQAPTIVVTTLPSNGTVTLGGVTPVGIGQQLTTSQLTGLDFTPAAGQIGTTSSFNYTVTDLAGNTSTGTATFSIAAAASTQLFDFLFTYNDGRDYYLGTVADSGNFGYQVGQIINTVAGHYRIFGIEPALTTQPSGTVSVSIYSHGGVGQASPTPILTGQGLPDGFGGLGSETDAILGIDGDLHPFSGAVEALFVTIPLWSFIYTYADGRAFYTGTVASETPVNSQNITDSAGNLIGTYSVFQQGLTTRANGTVVVDRFNVGGASFSPLRTGLSSVNGQVGLGSEQGLITVNGATFAFSNRLEPPVTISQPTLPSTTPPSPNDVFTAAVNQLYREILGRDADPIGLATFTAALATGTSITTIRTQLAQSSEAQSALNQLYHQIFGRDIDPLGANIYTDALINGLSLASIQLVLAQSPEGQAAIQEIYQEVLNRPADGGGLTTYMAAIGNPTAPMSLSDVRSVVAHGAESATGLSQLVLSTLGRSTFAAELVGLENRISIDGVTRQTLQTDLANGSAAANYSTVFDPEGSNLTAAQAGVPTLFVFTDVSLGSDGIVGFDPTRDTIQLPTSVAADFQTVQSKMQPNAVVGGTLIHFNSSQEIAIAGIAPGNLGSLNFRFA